MTATGPACLVLRLAGPLQSWGAVSRFNRRSTEAEPTKSGIVGLIAAAQGRRRSDPIEDLVGLQLGVRTDRSGTLLRDYHTVSDYRGLPLPTAAVAPTGLQARRNKAQSAVTQRFYLQDAVFVAALSAPRSLLADIGAALCRPQFSLSLGRRSCAPTMPLVLAPPGADGLLWEGDLDAVLAEVPWQVGSRRTAAPTVLPVTIDDPDGDDTRPDVPSGFDHRSRGFTSRRVRQGWVEVSGDVDRAGDVPSHDPFALLGW